MELNMWTIVDDSGNRCITSDTVTVKMAIDLGYVVYRNGKRVW